MDTLTQTFGKKAHNAAKLVDVLYQKPIVTVNDVAQALDVSKPTANTLVKEFEAKGTLQEVTGYQRNKHFLFTEYLEIYSKS